MRYLPEALTSRLVNHELAMEAVDRALVCAAGDGASSFPVVLGHAEDPDNRFSLKAATTAEVTGLKVGSYWRGNPDIGLPAHSSAILLFDARTGRVATHIEASLANCYRTAAADAIAVRELARPDARTLAIFGAGRQARFECEAVRQVRDIEEILIVNRDETRAAAFAAELRETGLRAQVASAEQACGRAEIIVTVTGARAPLFDGALVRPGCHISSMGSDGPGKQELPRALLRRGRFFCDYEAQSLKFGELQHVADWVASGQLRPVNLGDVLSKRVPGRTTDDEITIFDSSGLALQDLFLGLRLLEAVELETAETNLPPS
jgi:ornithine cyclodeaminase